MGAVGAGSVNLGDGSTGFNPAAMMAGMTLGGVVGQNIANSMNGMMAVMSNVQQAMTPPPLPKVQYHVAVNGQATGPYDLSALAQLITSGVLTKDTLVWKNGMENWDKAENQPDINALFANSMPPIPPVPPI